MKTCTKCGEEKPLTEFQKDPRYRGGHVNWCKACQAAYAAARRKADPERELGYQRKYREVHPDRVRAAVRAWAKAHPERDVQRYAKTKKRIFDHYGRVCVCCGRTDNLALDHIGGGGNQHRKEVVGNSGACDSFFRWLIAQGFPEGYQVLCKPCNSSKKDTDHCRLDHSALSGQRSIETDPELRLF